MSSVYEIPGAYHKYFFTRLCERLQGNAKTNRSEFKAFHIILPAALGPGVYSAFNRNEYQKQK
jgi:hypothetical protein